MITTFAIDFDSYFYSYGNEKLSQPHMLSNISFQFLSHDGVVMILRSVSSLTACSPNTANNITFKQRDDDYGSFMNNNKIIIHGDTKHIYNNVLDMELNTLRF